MDVNGSRGSRVKRRAWLLKIAVAVAKISDLQLNNSPNPNDRLSYRYGSMSFGTSSQSFLPLRLNYSILHVLEMLPFDARTSASCQSRVDLCLQSLLSDITGPERRNGRGQTG